VADYHNVYKRQDVFRCVHDQHGRFAHVVSPWHVLEAKRCWPEGCLSFDHRCSRLIKGRSCPRRFRRAGEKCQNCPSLREEKRLYVPEVVVAPPAWEAFRMDLQRYRLWLSGIRGRGVTFFGKVEAVKPFLKHVIEERRSRFLFSGWWVQFAEGYINRDHFRDRLYLYLPKGKQNRWKVVAGDEVEGLAQADVHEGRLILHQARSLELGRRGEGVPRRESDILLGLNLGSLFRRQEERCFSCVQGVLVNVENPAGLRNLPRRELFCLAGFRDPAACTDAVFSRIALEGCRRAS
jgi:hypothetical protein